MVDPGTAVLVVVAWVVLRLGIQQWVARRVASREISPRGAAVGYSVALAIAPLLLLPWRHTVEDVIFLTVAAAAIFIGKYAYINYAVSHRA